MINLHLERLCNNYWIVVVPKRKKEENIKSPLICLNAIVGFQGAILSKLLHV